MTLDYESRRMQLQRGNGWEKPFEDGPSLGFGLNRISHEQYQVLAVTPSSPARRVGLAAGDIVVALDGVPASRLGLDELRESMRRGGNRGLTVTVLRKGKPQELHIEAAATSAGPSQAK
jgi:C-terminal processing protease CtpA/Prc